MKSSIKQMNIGIAALALALASTLAQAADGRTRDATGPRMAPDPPGGNRSDPPAGRPVPYVSLTADIFYRVLASEIAAQRGMYGTAATTMVGLARDTGDPAWRAARWNSSWRAATCPAPWTRPGCGRACPQRPRGQFHRAGAGGGQRPDPWPVAGAAQPIDASRDKPAAIGQALAVLSRLNDRRLALRILDESFSDGVRKLPAAHMALADVANAAGDDERAAQEARPRWRPIPSPNPPPSACWSTVSVDPQRARPRRAPISRAIRTRARCA